MQTNDQKPDTTLADARHALDTGKFEIAAKLYDRALLETPNSLTIRNNLAVALRRLGRWSEAGVHLDFVLEREPHYENALLNKGLLCEALGQKEKAVAWYYRLIDVNPDSAVAYKKLGAVLADKEHYAQAIRAYQNALRCDPSYQRAYVEIGKLSGFMGRFTESAQAFEQFIQSKPKGRDGSWGVVEAHLLRSVLLLRVGDMFPGLKALGGILANRPEGESILVSAKLLVAVVLLAVLFIVVGFYAVIARALCLLWYTFAGKEKKANGARKRSRRVHLRWRPMLLFVLLACVLSVAEYFLFLSLRLWHVL